MENLRNLNINSVSIIGGISPDALSYERLSEVLRRYQEKWPRRPIDKLGFYEVDEVRHHVGLEIEVDRVRNANIALFTLEAHPFPTSERLRSSTRRRQEHQLSEIQEILAELEEFSLDSRLHSHVGCIFQPDSKKPIINLPMMTIQNPDVPFTEISGVRLRRETDAGLTTVTMDLRGDRSLVVGLTFPLSGLSICENIIAHTARTATTILGDFVLDVGIPFDQKEGQ